MVNTLRHTELREINHSLNITYVAIGFGKISLLRAFNLLSPLKIIG
jgi:hypothetical protein